MYLHNPTESFTVREPVCPRAPVTASSVTGTGPGAACDRPKPDPVPPAPPARRGCRVSVTGRGVRAYRAAGLGPNLKVC